MRIQQLADARANLDTPSNPRGLNSNEHRIVIAALETYQSMWAVAVTEAQRENEPIDERFTRERYVEAGELLARFKKDPEGADTLAMAGKLDANVAAEQARDREVATWPTPRATALRDVEMAQPLRAAISDHVRAVAHAASALRLYYTLPGRENGGAVHIITEDGNVEQEHADWCVENAPKWAHEFGGDAYLARDLLIARLLAALTDQQRKTLYDTGAFRPEESGERDARCVSTWPTAEGLIRCSLPAGHPPGHAGTPDGVATLDRLDHNLDDLRSADEEGEEQ